MLSNVTHHLPTRPTLSHAALGVAFVGFAEAATAAHVGASSWALAIGVSVATAVKALLIADVSEDAGTIGGLPV